MSFDQTAAGEWGISGSGNRRPDKCEPMTSEMQAALHPEDTGAHRGRGNPTAPAPPLLPRPAERAVLCMALGFLGTGALWDLAGMLGVLPPWWPPPGYVLIAFGIAAMCVAVLLRVLLTPRGAPRQPGITLMELAAVGVLIGALILRGDAEVPPDPPLVMAQLAACVAIFGALPLRRRGQRRHTAPTAALVLAAAGCFTAAGCAVSAAGSTDAQPATRHPAAPRIVAIGDLHGDLDATRRALRLAGAINAQDQWIGGRLVVVQTGDQLDRGDQERAILDLLDRVGRDAMRAGGALHVLNGNHELMNARLDLRYVTDGGFRDFRAFAPLHADGDSLLAAYPPEQRGRVAAFRPGGPYALRLARRNTIVMIGDNVFVHGGVLPHHAEYGIERINAEIRAWLRGQTGAPPWSSGSESPIWTRLYSQNVGEEACAALSETLRLLDATRMVVGHTVHREGITSYCDGRIWAIDVGKAAYYRGPVEVLEIRGDDVAPLSERR
jgi:hypothetical protein